MVALRAARRTDAHGVRCDAASLRWRRPAVILAFALAASDLSGTEGLWQQLLAVISGAEAHSMSPRECLAKLAASASLERASNCLRGC